MLLQAASGCDICRIKCSGGPAGLVNTTKGQLTYPFTLDTVGAWTNLSVSVYLFASSSNRANYTINIQRVSLGLASLQLTPGVLDPPFQTLMDSYTALSPQSGATLQGQTTFGPAVVNLTVNGAVTATGAASLNHALTLSSKQPSAAVVHVYLPDQPQIALPYTIMAQAVDLVLQTLALTTEGGVLSPAVFSPATTAYTATLPAGATGTVSVSMANSSELLLLCNNVSAGEGANTCALTAAVGSTLTFTVMLKNSAYNTTYSVFLTERAARKKGLSTDTEIYIGAGAGGALLLLLLVVCIIVRSRRRSGRIKYERLPDTMPMPRRPHTVEVEAEPTLASPFIQDEAHQSRLARARRMSSNAGLAESNFS